MRHSIRNILIELRKQKGNCAKTARKLGIHKSTVSRRKKQSSKGGRFFINQIKRESTRPTKIKYALTEKEESDIIEDQDSKKPLICMQKTLLQLDIFKWM